MSREEPESVWPEGVLGSTAGAVRVFWVVGQTMQELTDRLALALSEHLAEGDEMHVTYNAMQNGWHEHPPERGGVLHGPRPGWTELHFEYSAFVVLRARR